MPRKVSVRPSVIVVCSIAILGWSAAARAQAVEAFNPGANQTAWTLAMQPDGKIIVGGQFTGLGNGTGATLRNGLGRLNPDGTVDASFNPGTNSIVQAVAVQPDGKILIGGNFTSVGGGTGLTTIRHHLARLNSDGSVDTTFNPGANNNVDVLIVQPDGKILVGGAFTMLGGGGTGTTTRIALGRLNADGSLDSFNPGASKAFGGAPIVYTMALQPDGKIVVGGYLNGLGGGTGNTVRNYLGRLEADGSVDLGFNPGANSIGGVTALVLQADGKIVVGGSFTGLGLGTGTGSLRANIGRLHPDGSVDLTFNPGAEAQVNTLAVQIDGRIVLGGYFKWLGDQGGPARSVRNYIGRLNADGSVDSGFNPGAGNVLNAVAIQPDGAILAAGIFGTVGGGTGVATTRNRIARFTNTDAAVQSLTLTNGGTVETWLRSGAGPEVSRVTFEFSFDGSFYSMLGPGTRISGGWQLTSVNLPSARAVWIRARGYYGAGFQNGSGSIVESVLVLRPRRSEGDFDGDGTADITVYRPSNGTWFSLGSASGFTAGTGVPWGTAGDLPVPGDYDGDRKADVAVYRPSAGAWFLLKSTTGFTTSSTYQWGTTGDTPVPADYDGDGLTDIAVYRPSSATWFVLLSGTGFTGSAVYTWGTTGDLPLPADYDGDGKADLGLYRPSTGTWFILKSGANFSSSDTYQFGSTGDVPVPADYDGDGRTDIAVFRGGTWFLNQTSAAVATFTWGVSTDVPVPGDYDSDGKADIAVYRPSTGNWFILKSSSNNTSQATYQWGTSGDRPILASLPILRPRKSDGDFDGDGTADITIYRPSNGTWLSLGSASGFTAGTGVPWGTAGDLPVPGDYDGDRKTDVAVYRPSSGVWFLLKSTTGFTTSSTYQWGTTGDTPVPADYDGDGLTDIAVYRPSSTTWFVLLSGTGFTGSAVYAWGTAGDLPLPADYDGDGKADLGLYRPSTGTWFILKSGANFSSSDTYQFGSTGDVPVPADYDGDGRTDIAVFRGGTWFLNQTSAAVATFTWGVSTDVPVPGDYDSDGKADIAVYRPSTGNWFILKSSSNYTSATTYQWGTSGDSPILKRP